MPKLTIELNLPTQTDIEDFLAATGWTAQSGIAKPDWAKQVLAQYVKNVIKDKRVMDARRSQQIAVDQVSTQVDALVIS